MVIKTIPKNHHGLRIGSLQESYDLKSSHHHDLLKFSSYTEPNNNNADTIHTGQIHETSEHLHSGEGIHHTGEILHEASSENLNHSGETSQHAGEMLQASSEIHSAEAMLHPREIHEPFASSENLNHSGETGQHAGEMLQASSEIHSAEAMLHPREIHEPFPAEIIHAADATVIHHPDIGSEDGEGGDAINVAAEMNGESRLEDVERMTRSQRASPEEEDLTLPDREGNEAAQMILQLDQNHLSATEAPTIIQNFHSLTSHIMAYHPNRHHQESISSSEEDSGHQGQGQIQGQGQRDMSSASRTPQNVSPVDGQGTTSPSGAAVSLDLQDPAPESPHQTRYPPMILHTTPLTPPLPGTEDLGAGDATQSVEREIIFHTGNTLSDPRYRSTLASQNLIGNYYGNIALAGGLDEFSAASSGMKSRDLCALGTNSPGAAASNLLSIFPHLNTIVTNKSSGDSHIGEFQQNISNYIHYYNNNNEGEPLDGDKEDLNHNEEPIPILINYDKYNNNGDEYHHHHHNHEEHEEYRDSHHGNLIGTHVPQLEILALMEDHATIVDLTYTRALSFMTHFHVYRLKLILSIWSSRALQGFYVIFSTIQTYFALCSPKVPTSNDYFNDYSKIMAQKLTSLKTRLFPMYSHTPSSLYSTTLPQYFASASPSSTTGGPQSGDINVHSSNLWPSQGVG
ncbi:uncharacterized protein LOC103516252 [Diaphorina citri]|uniref:Uncharacterized protein LOC103516252 n=1 Tax=Diaphorina citri TaxID=121845 RepID=A0A3Q0JC38_DIACI|nr:uncharacterized protein LOC103516252 [Diaphorina citri]